MQSGSVKYTVRVPAAAESAFSTVNGGVELRGLTGRVRAETTNGGVVARNVSGTLDAVTTNGGVDVELARVGRGRREAGVHERRHQAAAAGRTLARRSRPASPTAASTQAAFSSTRPESQPAAARGRLNGGGPPIRIGDERRASRIGAALRTVEGRVPSRNPRDACTDASAARTPCSSRYLPQHDSRAGMCHRRRARCLRTTGVDPRVKRARRWPRRSRRGPAASRARQTARAPRRAEARPHVLVHRQPSAVSRGRASLRAREPRHEVGFRFVRVSREMRPLVAPSRTVARRATGRG